MTNNLYIPLENRSVIAISGNDATKFLQGLITNDIHKVSDVRSIYTLMLTPQGKFLYDFFIAKAGDKFLLDCDKQKLPDIINRFKMYKLRSDVTIENLSESFVTVAALGTKIFENFGSMEQGYTKSLACGVIYIDPRSSALYARAIIAKDNMFKIFEDNDFKKEKISEYEKVRISNCIPLGHIDLLSEESFPHEYKMDEIGAIDYNKGCYVGQEVTARVHHRGTGRRSLYVLEKTTNESFPPAGTEIFVDEKSVGKILASTDSISLSIINIETVEKQKNIYRVGNIEVGIRS